MTEIELIVDLHLEGQRQGPGGEEETKQAMALAGLISGPNRATGPGRADSGPLKIADIGCGTGASTMILARDLDAEVTAVDFLPEFLEVLRNRATEQQLEEKIKTLESSMDALPFNEGEFDVIWSEGAIYNMGFEAGVASWKRYLKPGGKLVVSEITWLGETRPEELENHWKTEYPEIDLASAKIGVLERNGFSPEAYFALPEHCWMDNYYHPMQARFDDFLERNGRSEMARSIVEAERYEIALYEKYREFVSYGVYVARRI